jgi:hypothetical protein
MGIPSFGSITSGISNAVGAAAGKVADAVTQKSAPATETPAAPQQKPAFDVDSFQSAPSKPVNCGGNSTSGAQCLPDWGKASGGGGGGAGINPSGR